ncbi:MAG: hypothetical protein H6Q68_1330 [Firmicutes bacterium]|nr:hypothetical protein [Bacillota bacterium]
MYKFLKINPFFLAFVLLGAIFLWAPVCQGHLQLMNGNEVPMKCFYTGKTSVILSILFIIVGIEDVLRKKISSLFFIGMGIVLFLLPNNSWGIGVCKKETMACITTALWIKGVGVGSVLYGIVTLFKKDIIQVPD